MSDIPAPIVQMLQDIHAKVAANGERISALETSVRSVLATRSGAIHWILSVGAAVAAAALTAFAMN